MGNLKEWELRQIQLELEQLDEDYMEFNNFFESDASYFSEEKLEECAIDWMTGEDYTTDYDYQAIGLLTPINAVDEESNDQLFF